ncbi:fibronectin type III domain-containing protein, partial [Acinetobacter baumannii]|uniref:fibronectin type III domain-containing protein n=1 Tax=Acinetobacter baumannii TaxID=470 RepID=UPI002B226BB7
MTKAFDYVRVGGQFITHAGSSHEGYLTAGILEVNGDFTQKRYMNEYGFYGSSTHKVILNGSDIQTVHFDSPRYSRFNILSITKPLETGYKFNTTPVWVTLIEEVWDSEPPTAPTELKVNSSSWTTVSLSWKESHDNVKVAGYEIYRNGSRIGISETNKYTDRGLSPNTEYIYTVRAYDVVGNLSDPSVEVQVMTDTDSEPPTAPADLELSSRTGNTVTLLWKGSIDNVKVAGYEIYRDGKRIGDSETPQFTDTLLNPGVFKYTVLAYDVAGNKSEMSSELIVDLEAPSVPTGLSILTTSDNSITLNWTASTDGDGLGVAGYEIYRDGVKIGTSKETTYNDKSLVANTTYTYTIKAYDLSGNVSEASAPIEGSTIIDDEAPTIPSNVRIHARTGSTLTIMWDSSTDNQQVAGYEILRDGVVIGHTTELQYTDTELKTGLAYRYAIQAFDANGNKSDRSAVVEGTPILPHIKSVDPASGKTLGGTKPQRMTIYFINSQNAEGAQAIARYSFNDSDEVVIDVPMQGPYRLDSTTSYFN